MHLGMLKHAPGAKKKPKRIGRGTGSGHGKTATRGHKGLKARSGASHRAWFEGGQMPLQRRIPKRGFVHLERKEYQIVRLSQLEGIGGPVVQPENLYKARLAKKNKGQVKILSDGELKKPLEIHAHAFSKKAVEKIEAAGGKAVRI
ncbi:50S ribosomal protein L15 [bacterium]|nr:50S ribosomal protein L15 [bacterium]